MPRSSISTKRRLAIFMAGNGHCDICGGKILPGDRWEVSHRIPLALGGADDDSNMFPAHYGCHRASTAQADVPAIARAKRREARHIGAKTTKRPMPGSRASGWKKHMDGRVTRRGER